MLSRGTVLILRPGSAELLPDLAKLHAKDPAAYAEELRDATDIMENFELFFTVAFTIELLLNFFANHFLPFFKSAWNIFDLLVVIICWLAEASDAVPSVRLLRLLRVFRVVR
jgi:hypothetical protein